jgi:iron-regulated transporter 1
MRRIDLACKLMGPLFIAFMDGIATDVAILVNLGMNLILVIVEYFAIAQVRFTFVSVPRRLVLSQRS